MPNELKPCPFCGSKAIVTEINCYSFDNTKTRIECSMCGVCLDWEQEFMIHENKNEIGEVLSVVKIPINISAFDAWNRRVDNG